eukprot:643741-Hanusia_phi.AAC.1
MTLQLTGACKSHGLGIRDLEPNLNDWLCNFNSSDCRSRDLGPRAAGAKPDGNMHRFRAAGFT